MWQLSKLLIWQVTATVIEKGTELEANATWSTEVKSRSSLIIDMHRHSSVTFKSGLPFYGTLKIEHVDGTQSVNNETKVNICHKPTDEKRHTNDSKPVNMAIISIDVCVDYQPDANGYVHYYFFPFDRDAIYYNLKVYILNKTLILY